MLQQHLLLTYLPPPHRPANGVFEGLFDRVTAARHQITEGNVFPGRNKPCSFQKTKIERLEQLGLCNSRRRWSSNPSGKCSYERPTRGTVCGTMRSMCGADAGCLAINYQSLFATATREHLLCRRGLRMYSKAYATSPKCSRFCNRQLVLGS